MRPSLLFVAMVISLASQAMTVSQQGELDKEIIAHKAQGAPDWKHLQSTEQALEPVANQIKQTDDKARKMDQYLSVLNKKFEAIKKRGRTPYENKVWLRYSTVLIDQFCCRAKSDPTFFKFWQQQKEKWEQRRKSK